MPMDPQLAAIYGTNQDESDVEKLAAAELAEELTEEETAELSDEEAEALAEQLLAGEENEEGAEVEEPSDETNEEQEKLSEADYLGRVMAHAYTQELRKIAADPGAQRAKYDKMGTEGPSFGAKVRNKLDPVVKAGRSYGQAMAGGKGASGWKERLVGKEGQRLKVHGARGATLAAGAGLAYGAKKLYDRKKGKTKRSSALDTLAEQRALEILAENGIDPSGQEQEKTSASEQEMAALQNAVEQRAFELLQANGYISEE